MGGRDVAKLMRLEQCENGDEADEWGFHMLILHRYLDTLCTQDFFLLVVAPTHCQSVGVFRRISIHVIMSSRSFMATPILSEAAKDGVSDSSSLSRLLALLEQMCELLSLNRTKSWIIFLSLSHCKGLNNQVFKTHPIHANSRRAVFLIKRFVPCHYCKSVCSLACCDTEPTWYRWGNLVWRMCAFWQPDAPVRWTHSTAEMTNVDLPKWSSEKVWEVCWSS